jgi:hypothetical protein
MGRLAKEAKIATLTQAQMEVLDQLVTRRCQVTEEKPYEAARKMALYLIEKHHQ